MGTLVIECSKSQVRRTIDALSLVVPGQRQAAIGSEQDTADEQARFNRVTACIQALAENFDPGEVYMMLAVALDELSFPEQYVAQPVSKEGE